MAALVLPAEEGNFRVPWLASNSSSGLGLEMEWGQLFIFIRLLPRALMIFVIIFLNNAVWSTTVVSGPIWTN